MKHSSGEPVAPTLAQSLGLADVFAQNNPRLAMRLAKKRRASLTDEQLDILEALLYGDEQYGDRRRSDILAVRLGHVIKSRLQHFLDDYRRVEKNRLVEIALDRLLRAVGY